MKKIFLLLVILFQLSIVAPVLAQTDYTLLQPLPLSGADQQPVERTNAGNYIKGMFMLIIAIAGGLAVITIIFGGIKYMSSDAIGGKSDAKKTIQNAIGGLLLAISAWLILTTINPNLKNFDLKLKTTSPPAQTLLDTGGGGDS